MALPLCTTPDDVKKMVAFLSRKPSGVGIDDARKVLGETLVDNRKIATLQALHIVHRENGKLKLTQDIGRVLSRANDQEFAELLRKTLAGIPAYSSCLEWTYHKNLSELTTADLGAFWHDHFREELGTEIEREITQRAVCFFQLASGAALGKFLVGRKGQQTRLVVDRAAIEVFLHAGQFDDLAEESLSGVGATTQELDANQADDALAKSSQSVTAALLSPSSKAVNEVIDNAGGNGIFVGHGKNKKPLEQLKVILDQFKIPYRVAVEEPNLGRPISEKVRETMRSCDCAILIFTADEELFDKDGHSIWRPSENVVHELGASGLLFGKRIVILKEDGVSFPSNFRDIGYISFSKDELNAKAMDVLKELIGFGIVKVTT